MPSPKTVLIRCSVLSLLLGASWSSQALTINGCVIVASPTPLSHTTCPGANLSGQNLSGLDLSYADFTSVVTLDTDGTIQTIDRAALDNADLTGANLTGADLTGADLNAADLTNANLTNAKVTCGTQAVASTNLCADLRDADLSNANLTNAEFSGARLQDADMGGATVTGMHALRIRTSCPMVLPTAEWRCLLNNDYTMGQNLFLDLVGPGADLSYADLRGADLSGLNLTGADLTGADLSNADFTDTNLTDANLTNANLSGAVFYNTTLVGTTLTGANMPAGIVPSGNGDNALALFGSAIAVADMNADGYDDLLVGAPLEDVYSPSNALLKDAGQIRIISGKDNQVLDTLNGTVTAQRFGTAIAVVADQNTDGVPDLVVGEPLAAVTINNKPVKAGRVALYSGADGAFISELAQGAKVGDQFGAAVAVGDDQNTATLDLIVGAPYVDVTTLSPAGKNVVMKDAGQVTVFTGLSNTPRYMRSGTQAGEHFGAAVAVDAAHRVLVGSPTWDPTVMVNTKFVKLLDAGKVQVFAGADGVSAALFQKEGAIKGDRLGSAVSGSGTDIDHDGNADWLVGMPGFDASAIINLKNTLFIDTGKVYWFSGLDPVPVLEITGAAAGENFGSAVSALGDVDNDNTSDLVMGAPKYNVSVSYAGVNYLLKWAGRVESLSGVTLLSN